MNGCRYTIQQHCWLLPCVRGCYLTFFTLLSHIVNALAHLSSRRELYSRKWKWNDDRDCSSSELVWLWKGGRSEKGRRSWDCSLYHTLYTIHHTLYTILYTIHNILYIHYTQFRLCSIHYTLYYTLFRIYYMYIYVYIYILYTPELRLRCIHNSDCSLYTTDCAPAGLFPKRK